MKTERESSSGSEGDDHFGDFVDVESEAGDGYQYQYQEYDVNTFLDSVLTGVGTDDLEIKRLGKVLKKACAEGNLVQLVRGVLHLVELYQATKMSRSRPRPASGGTEEKRTAPSKNSNKGTRPSTQAVGDGQRGRNEDGGHSAVPQGRNTVEGLTEIEREENTGISESDPSRSNQGQKEAENESEGFQGLEPSIILKREIDDERPPVEKDKDKEDGNGFQGKEENMDEEERQSPSRPPRPEDESSMSENSSRIDPYSRASKRRKRLRKTSQKKRKTSESEHVSNAGGQNYSSSTESDVSRRGEYYSSSSSSSRSSSSRSRSRSDVSRHRGNYSSRSESDVSRREEHSDDPASNSNDEGGRVLGNWEYWERSQNEAPEDSPNPIPPANNPSGEVSSSRSFVSRHDESIPKKRKRTHECPVCKKLWESKAHLKIHLAVHTKERPFLCHRPNCGKKFKSKRSLARHLRSHDGDRDKPFKCAYPRCRKAFASQEGLDEHREVHTRERPFTCDHPGCFADFPSRTTLRRHKGTHSEERPFKCLFQGCGRSYKDRQSLTRHQKTCNRN